MNLSRERKRDSEALWFQLGRRKNAQRTVALNKQIDADRDQRHRYPEGTAGIACQTYATEKN